LPKKDAEGNDMSDEDLSEKIYMVMELARYKEVMTWDLNNYKFIPNSHLLQIGCQQITQSIILKIIKDCVLALKYLHYKAGILHRDIKPQNILIC
jgi:serine/threonine protein kinase